MQKLTYEMNSLFQKTFSFLGEAQTCFKVSVRLKIYKKLTETYIETHKMVLFLKTLCDLHLLIVNVIDIWTYRRFYLPQKATVTDNLFAQFWFDNFKNANLLTQNWMMAGFALKSHPFLYFISINIFLKHTLDEHKISCVLVKNMKCKILRIKKL